MYKVFIDGKAGTTGLRIYDRLLERKDIVLMTLPEEKRKDPAFRSEMINSSDISFLCLPDAAARESVSLANSDSVRIIDTSTAHRTEPGWAYGFPELSYEHREKIKNGSRIAVPGCHASGFIVSVYPLVKSGVIDKDYPLSCFSLTGYSGGGKKMIAEYEEEGRDALLKSPRQYATAQMHKHLKEMQHITGIASAPIFSPVVADYYSGMEVTLPLFPSMFKKKCSAKDIADIYNEYYGKSNMIICGGYDEENEFVAAGELSGYDDMLLTVRGNDDRIIVTAVYDNLGKGASGAALQCMNIMLGIDETEGLNLSPRSAV